MRAIVERCRAEPMAKRRPDASARKMRVGSSPQGREPTERRGIVTNDRGTTNSAAVKVTGTVRRPVYR
jgi:hypothetical protein